MHFRVIQCSSSLPLELLCRPLFFFFFIFNTVKLAAAAALLQRKCCKICTECCKNHWTVKILHGYIPHTYTHNNEMFSGTVKKKRANCPRLAKILLTSKIMISSFLCVRENSIKDVWQKFIDRTLCLMKGFFVSRYFILEDSIFFVSNSCLFVYIVGTIYASSVTSMNCR